MTGITALLKQGTNPDQVIADQVASAKRLMEHGDVFLTVALKSDRKSIDQNDMFRGLCRDISEYWNANNEEKTTAEAVARDLKVQYGVISTHYSPVSGKRSARIKSTAEYTKPEMSALISATLAWAADMGIPLPDPRHA